MNWWTCHSPTDRVIRGVVAFLLLAMAASSTDLPWFAVLVGLVGAVLAFEAITGRGARFSFRKH